MFCSVNDAAEMTARHAEALKVLAERALALACAVQERALVAETDAGMAELGLAFHRIARSARQCLALEAKLTRDAEQAARAARAEAAHDHGAEVKRRRRHLRAVLTREIAEADAACDDEDDSEADARTERLETLLDEDELSDDFLAMPLEEQIAGLRHDVGLAEAALAAAPGTPDGAALAPHPQGGAGSGGGAAVSPALAALAPNSS